MNPQSLLAVERRVTLHRTVGASWGLSLTCEGTKHVVEEIVEGSPGQKAGVLTGDNIIVSFFCKNTPNQIYRGNRAMNVDGTLQMHGVTAVRNWLAWFTSDRVAVGCMLAEFFSALSRKLVKKIKSMTTTYQKKRQCQQSCAVPYVVRQCATKGALREVSTFLVLH